MATVGLFLGCAGAVSGASWAVLRIHHKTVCRRWPRGVARNGLNVVAGALKTIERGSREASLGLLMGFSEAR